MIGLDTNILARYYIDDDADSQAQSQRLAARRLLDSGQLLMVSKSVLLELEGVMRGCYLAATAFHPRKCWQFCDICSRCPRSRSKTANRCSVRCPIARQVWILPMHCTMPVMQLASALLPLMTASLYAEQSSWLCCLVLWCRNRFARLMSERHSVRR